jgi:hypothetical protein
MGAVSRIKAACNDDADLAVALRTLITLVDKACTQPDKPKQRRVRIGTKAFMKQLGSKDGGVDALKAFGFVDMVDDGKKSPKRKQRQPTLELSRTEPAFLESATAMLAQLRVMLAQLRVPPVEAPAPAGAAAAAAPAVSAAAAAEKKQQIERLREAHALRQAEKARRAEVIAAGAAAQELARSAFAALDPKGRALHDLKGAGHHKALRVLKGLSQELRGDVGVVRAAVAQSGIALEHASVALKDDAATVQAAVAQDGWALQYASVRLKNDAATVRVAVAQNGEVLKLTSAVLKDDAATVRAAVAQNGKALQYASDAVKNDAPTVRVAIAQNGRALRYASVRKTPFLRHFILQAMILPRQARDKHKEKLKKKAVFAGCSQAPGGRRVPDRRARPRHYRRRRPVRR